ncbi:polyadenylate-binding protein-interacting protein 9 [Capsicum chacoense]|uniref:Polyadenylate-binding protein-interacting protein 9 n=1 Tax=Capsicum annuum TaxID=4072 RepID=A0A2G2Z4M0_CAPAN|nr:polyadenylate-binding protein-interacting protein 9 [Capsicum annuum]KAF3681026.1 Polyadenylate-binding protein-interacting protein 9 [Capsicum annuum]PHT76936.1 Polyadenylate-binding protein-interacting protein 9 [Capsicum annuum]
MAAETAVIESGSAAGTKSESLNSEQQNVNSESVVVVNSEVKDYKDVAKSEYKMEDIVNMLKKLKLNPQAKEFVPSYCYSSNNNNYHGDQMLLNNFMMPVMKIVGGTDDSRNNGKRGNSCNQGRRRMNNRALRAQREDSIRRTVYVSDIDHNITEERLAALFSAYGQVVDCRVCGDPHSRLRFAFVEFADEYSAGASLNLCGTLVGFSPLKVLPSKTAILPVNPTFLPRSEDEREMCARTVYCTNIDKKVSQADVKNFFETRCGEVSRLRLLGDQVHSTRIAFVEFVMAESAIVALDCCGQILGSQPIRVSPSKTPVRPRVPRSMMH